MVIIYSSTKHGTIKTALGDQESNLLYWRAKPLPREDNNNIDLLQQNQWAIQQNLLESHTLWHGKIMTFDKHFLMYIIIALLKLFLLRGNFFSGEHYEPQASCHLLHVCYDCTAYSEATKVFFFCDQLLTIMRSSSAIFLCLNGENMRRNC